MSVIRTHRRKTEETRLEETEKERVVVRGNIVIARAVVAVPTVREPDTGRRLQEDHVYIPIPRVRVHGQSLSVVLDLKRAMFGEKSVQGATTRPAIHPKQDRCGKIARLGLHKPVEEILSCSLIYIDIPRIHREWNFAITWKISHRQRRDKRCNRHKSNAGD